MTGVSQILAQLAENAGRAQLIRGQNYASLVTAASQVPAQIMDAREHRTALELQRARDAQALLTSQHADAWTQQEHAQALKDQNDWKQISRAMYAPDKEGGVDYAAAIAKAQEIGAPEKIPTIQQHARDNMPKVGEAAEGTAGRYLSGPHAGELVPGSLNPKTRADYTVNGVRYNGNTNQAYGPATPLQTPPRAVQSEGFRISGGPMDGMNVKGVFDPNAHDGRGGYFYNDQDYTGSARVIPPAPSQSGMNTLYGDVDPKAIANAIRTGQEPPDLEKYGRVASAAIASALLQPDPDTGKVFDRYAAVKQYGAIKRLTATLNGTNQVRYDEAIRSGLAMYDKVDELAAQWDGKGWGPLSQANLAAARNGLKGAEAASIANQLTGQIGQLTSDVATLEQGGLTPTNESRQIAEKSMRDWWGKGTILAMTQQGRYNMQIRHLARGEVTPLVPGDPANLQPATPATPPGGAAVGTYPGQPGALGGGITAPPKEGDKRPIPGFPGTEQTMIGGKWIRTK